WRKRDMSVSPMHSFPGTGETPMPLMNEKSSLCSMTALLNKITLPQPLEGVGQCLPGHAAIRVFGGFGKDVAIVIPLGLESRGHALIGDHPIVQRRFIAGSTVVVFADLEPDADGFGWGARDEMFVVFPGAVGRFRIRWRLLV